MKMIHEGARRDTKDNKERYPAFLTGGWASAGKVFVFSILQRFFWEAFRVQTALGAPWLT